ncbi:MAG: 23S rRNA (pseudouridine(1915)-N(3))-methyltransferase RlmH [Proteobacteria bacterium]|nr:23S rRNA (pseudouridine(1915)-N(3))-methyltransferase RlmH [Pseudomonadota bacterium]
MRLRVIAVGTRMPGWVRAACEDYLKRFPPAHSLQLVEVAAGARAAGAGPELARASEGERLLGAVRAGEHVVALDERGRALSTRELAGWLGERRQAGLDVSLLIGGPDGLAPPVLARADGRWSLSRLTLPHALARVLAVEQLYRAHTILAHHPYHRD